MHNYLELVYVNNDSKRSIQIMYVVASTPHVGHVKRPKKLSIAVVNQFASVERVDSSHQQFVIETISPHTNT